MLIDKVTKLLKVKDKEYVQTAERNEDNHIVITIEQMEEMRRGDSAFDSIDITKLDISDHDDHIDDKVTDTYYTDAGFLEDQYTDIVDRSDCNELIENAEEDSAPYKSSRSIIKGLSIYFVDIAREAVEHGEINKIPLMREYRLSEQNIDEIIDQLFKANIIDSNNKPTINAEQLEKFLDIYEPTLFDCSNTIFDKDLFLCVGEIIFDKGVESCYSALPADEVIDYLNIMEKLNVIKYDSDCNKYDVIMDSGSFHELCEYIPCVSSEFTENSVCSDDYDNLSGIEFEKYCASLLKQNGFFEIEITKESGDHGIDILAEKDDISYAIQCKCYTSNVGNEAVQQAHTGKSIYKRDIAVVMTNRYFTPQAIEEAKTLGVKLWDRDKISKMNSVK